MVGQAAGFPLHKRIKTALMGFMEGYARSPKGVNIQTIANLKERKWVTQSVEDYQAVYGQASPPQPASSALSTAEVKQLYLQGKKERQR